MTERQQPRSLIRRRPLAFAAPPRAATPRLEPSEGGPAGPIAAPLGPTFEPRTRSANRVVGQALPTAPPTAAAAPVRRGLSAHRADAPAVSGRALDHLVTDVVKPGLEGREGLDPFDYGRREIDPTGHADAASSLIERLVDAI